MRTCPCGAAAEAIRLALEDLVDDLIEAGNGLALDDAWRERRIRDLLDARDRPEAFLQRARARVPGPLGPRPRQP